MLRDLGTPIPAPGPVESSQRADRLRVCFLSSAHSPLDKRVFEKEARSLAAHGFLVWHVAPDSQYSEGVQNDVHIFTYPQRAGVIGRLLSLTRAYRLAARLNPDYYHCNEVDSWILGLLLKIRYGKRVVFDVHEQYPNDVAERLFPVCLHGIVAFLCRCMFRVLVRWTDAFVFAKKFLNSDYPGVTHKSVLVENFVPLRDRVPGSSSDAVQGQYVASAPVTAIHIGLMGRVRCWPQLLEALTMVKAQQIRVFLVGTFIDGSEKDFDQRVSELSLGERVRRISWVPYSEAFENVARCQIGLVLLAPEYTNHTVALPHKMFDYMLAAIPVIAPRFAREVQDIIRENDCGLLIDTSKPNEIAWALERLAGDERERRRMGENGRRAVVNRYNWEGEARKLIRLYEEMEKEVRSPAPAAAV